MNVFLGEVAKHLAGHWARLVVLPGLLYIAVLVAAYPLTPWRSDVAMADALDLTLVPDHLRAIAADIRGSGAAAMAAVAVFLLVGALLLGQAAEGMATFVERFWLGVWPARAAEASTRRRQQAWATYEARIHALLTPPTSPIRLAAVAAYRMRQYKISLSPPQRPTWMGDRMASVETQIEDTYSVPLRSCWPHLWMVMPDRARQDLQTAAQRFREQAIVAGWGCLAVAAAVYWWPVAIIVPGFLLVAWRRGRDGLDQFAQLVEAAFDLYAAELARALGIAVPGQMTATEGGEIAEVVVKYE